jgi:hypothetical protein
MDIATGNISTAENPTYGTKGPKDVYGIKNEPVMEPGSQCYVLDKGQCTNDQWETVMNGTALIKNWIVVDANTSSLFPGLVGGNGTRPSGTPSSSGSPAQYTSAGTTVARGVKVKGWDAGLFGRALLAAVIGSLLTTC